MKKFLIILAVCFAFALGFLINTFISPKRVSIPVYIDQLAEDEEYAVASILANCMAAKHLMMENELSAFVIEYMKSILEAYSEEIIEDQKRQNKKDSLTSEPRFSTT